jgi:TrmH family RNA methyltransferase
MDSAQPITNAHRKLVTSLQKRKEREENGLFVAEGERLCAELLKSTFTPQFIVIRTEASSETKLLAKNFISKGFDVYLAGNKHFDQLCDTKSPQDILAVVRMKELPFSNDCPVIALDGISDPGNLGTIIRTAEWFGFQNIILSPDSVDQFNPKVVRASMGSVFRCSIKNVSDLASYLKNAYSNYEIYGAALDAKLNIQDCKPKSRFLIVFGNEANGISSSVMKAVTHKFIIPGGGAESLNVAVSAGISFYHFNQVVRK